MNRHSTDPDPHGPQRVLRAGAPLEKAAAAMIFIHGRGATPEDILSLSNHLRLPNFALLAPAAANRTWYPHSFLAPIDNNEPKLSSALKKIAALVEELEAAGIDGERIFLLGFSQGACLTSEFVARNPKRYGGVAALTGGLIGPDDTPRTYQGSLNGTPVLLGTSDPDPHVPLSRVDETAQILTDLGAQVTQRVYPGMGHQINDEELALVQQMIDGLLSPGTT